MTLAEGFWWLLTALCVLWYLTVTVYVAARGALDLRSMLARLEAEQNNLPPAGNASGDEDAPRC